MSSLSHKVNISRLPYSADSYDLDLSVLCSITNTSEKYERTQQGNLLGICNRNHIEMGYLEWMTDRTGKAIYCYVFCG